MNLLTTLLAFAVTLGILITIHEFGHYWVARRCGVKVLSFSIGFGKPLFTFRRKKDPDQVEWRISALPLGGYVRMLDERDPKCLPISDADKSRTFNSKNVWQRFAIVVAGPLSNLILPVILYAFIFMAGVTELLPVLDAPAPNTPAAVAGIEKGDKVLAVDDKKISTYSDFRLALLDKAGTEPVLSIEQANGNHLQKRLDLRHVFIDDANKSDPLDKTGIRVAVGLPVVRSFVEGSTAEKAGLEIGDVVHAVNGVLVESLKQMIQEIQKHPDEELDFSVRGEDGRERSVMIPVVRATDPEGREVGRIGTAFGVELPVTTISYNPIRSLWEGAVKTWDSAVFTVKMIGRMVTGEVSVKNISGPVTIADYAGQTARMGVEPFISFLALVSLSLGILNLLPIPLLDGGHLLYYSVEMVTGKPVSETVQAFAQKMGVAVLLGLTMLALFNDMMRLLS